MEDDKIPDWPTVCPTVPQEMRMNEQDLGTVAEARELMAEDTALQLFQIAALMLGDEQEAVSLVEEVVAKVEADPCAEGTLAYAEARTLLVRTAVQRMVPRGTSRYFSENSNTYAHRRASRWLSIFGR